MRSSWNWFSRTNGRSAPTASCSAASRRRSSAEALAGWREVAVRERKTKIDWAVEMARLLEGRYAACTKVILVCDNLNAYTKGAFYEAFEPARARALVRGIEFCAWFTRRPAT